MGRDRNMADGLTTYQRRMRSKREADRRVEWLLEKFGDEIGRLPGYMQDECRWMARKNGGLSTEIMHAVRAGSEVLLRVRACRPDVAARWVAERGA